MPGPVPKPSAQRRRRNVESRTTKARRGGKVTVPEGDESWHPLAWNWFAALKESGQSAFYESSDWQQAYFIAELMSRCLSAPKVSPTLVAQILTASTELLTTEGARRRLRMELERVPEVEPASVRLMADYRAAAE